MALFGEKNMTVREVAEYFQCNPETIKVHIRDIFPDLMENGKTTYLNEAQITVILEKMKCESGIGAGVNLQNQIVGIETEQSLELQIALESKKLESLYQKALERERVKRIEAEKQVVELGSKVEEQEKQITDQEETIGLIADNAANRQYKKTLRTECTMLIRKLAKKTGKGYAVLWREAYERFMAMHSFSNCTKVAFLESGNKIDFLAKKDIEYLKDLKQAITALLAKESAA